MGDFHVFVDLVFGLPLIDFPDQFYAHNAHFCSFSGILTTFVFVFPSLTEPAPGAAARRAHDARRYDVAPTRGVHRGFRLLDRGGVDVSGDIAHRQAGAERLRRAAACWPGGGRIPQHRPREGALDLLT